MLNHSREINFDDGVTGATLEDNRELLSAKRKNERLSAYRFLIKNLSEDHQKEFLENSSETLFEAIINSCKRGDAEEKSLAITLASVLYISIAPDRVEEFFQRTDGLFKDVLKTSKDNLKSLTASAIAISSALSDSNTSENLQKVSSLLFESLKVLSGQLDSKDHQPLVLMVKSWAFVISLIKPKTVEEKCFIESVAFLVTLLEDNNVQVRLTVAQTLVMLFEIVKQNSEEEEDGEFNLEDYQNIFDLDELLEVLREKNSKTEINVRRKFEKIVQVLESNLEEEISEDLSGNFSQIKISSWAQSAQLEYFIEIIGKGLVTHFGRNVVFKTFFGNQKNIESLNQKELKKSTKLRELERKKMRDNKNQNY